MARIIEQIIKQANKHKDKIAFYYYTDNKEKTLTYQEFVNLIYAFCHRIKEKNIAFSSTAFLVGSNSPWWPAAYLAAHMNGLAVAHGDAGFTEEEFANLEKFIKPSVILCEKKFAQYFQSTENIICFEDIMPEFSNTEPELRIYPENQPMSIIFTSGTTGEAKGVMLSEKNYLSNLRVFSSMKNLITEKDLVVAMLPLHHVYPFTCTVLAPLYFGASII